MNPEEIRTFCLGLSDTTEDFPFGPENLVFRTGGKIYLILDLETADPCNVKCDPEKAIEYREEFPADVMPGYHMNKKHWNTIRLNGKLPRHLIENMIRESHELVAAKSSPRKSKPPSIK